MNKDELILLLKKSLTIEIFTDSSDNTITIALYFDGELICKDVDTCQVQPITNIL